MQAIPTTRGKVGKFLRPEMTTLDALRLLVWEDLPAPPEEEVPKIDTQMVMFGKPVSDSEATRPTRISTKMPRTMSRKRNKVSARTQPRRIANRRASCDARMMAASLVALKAIHPKETSDGDQ